MPSNGNLNNFRVSAHFWIAELVSRAVLERCQAIGVDPVGFIDSRQIEFLEYQRTVFGITILNTWWEGGSLDSRGFRSKEDPDGGEYSQHRYGRATDSQYPKYPAEEVRQYIKQNWKQVYYPRFGITRVEMNVSWLHADQKLTLGQTDLIFVPVPKPRS